MLAVHSYSNNAREFTALIGNLSTGCLPDTLERLLYSVQPNPAQVFQTIEVVFLTTKNINSIPSLLEKVGGYLTTSKNAALSSISHSRDAAALHRGFCACADLLEFCSNKLNALGSEISIVGCEENTACPEEKRAFKIAEIQDEVRLALRINRVQAFDRDNLIDPVGTSGKRSREEFLGGLGVISPNKLLV